MKKLFWIAVIVLLGVYGSGYASFSSRGVVGYLDDWERRSLDGDADGVCDLLHEDLEVAIDDRSTGRPIRMEGGKAEFCEYTRQTVPAMKFAISGMNVRRENIEIKHEWQHPWTAEVSYTEQRSISMGGGAVQIDTIGEDKFILVKTFDGVKIRRLEAVTRLQRET